MNKEFIMKNIFYMTKLIVMTIILSFCFTGCVSTQKGSSVTPFEGSFSGLSGDGFTEMIFKGNILEIKINGISNAKGKFEYTDKMLIWHLTHAYIPKKNSTAVSGVFEALIMLNDQYKWIKIPFVKTVTTWDYRLVGDELFLSNYETASSTLGQEIRSAVSGNFPPLTKNKTETSLPGIWALTPPYTIAIAGGYKGYGGNISIPSKIRDAPLVSLGPSSFSSCGITQVQFSNSVKLINQEAFSSNLIITLEIPDGVLLIGNQAFLKNKITELTIGKGALVIGAGAFAGNPIKKITVKSPDVFIFDTAFDTDFKSAFLKNGAGSYFHDNGTWKFER
jgi:hypothetical protein